MCVILEYVLSASHDLSGNEKAWLQNYTISSVLEKKEKYICRAVSLNPPSRRQY